MLGYRLHGNRRIDRANEKVLELVRADSRVVELGCGIGLTTEAIGGKLATGHCWSFDISPKNIWYARQTVHDANVTFAVADFVSVFSSVESLVPGPVDLVVMVDVVEHVPAADRQRVLADCAALVSRMGCLFLSFPSPWYQRHLAQNERDELQPVDEIIELATLNTEAIAAGWHIKEWILRDVWLRNQYVHAVLLRDTETGPTRDPGSRREGLGGSLMARVLDRLLARYRRWKYVERVWSRDASAPSVSFTGPS